MTDPLYITSRSNPLVVRLRRLARDGDAYRKLGHVWLEGEHLCDAVLRHSQPVAQAVFSEAGWQDRSLRALARNVSSVAVLAEPLFRSLSALGSPGSLGFVVALPPPASLDPRTSAIVLDRLQDPGNAGSMLRSAAALGVAQVWAMKGSVALWSPKVLRAAMGAHFALKVIETGSVDELVDTPLPLIATSSHDGVPIQQARLPWPCAFVFGHEGQGLDGALAERCALRVRIQQSGREESLNVAAAAAICLYEAQRQRLEQL